MRDATGAESLVRGLNWAKGETRYVFRTISHA